MKIALVGIMAGANSTWEPLGRVKSVDVIATTYSSPIVSVDKAIALKAVFVSSSGTANPKIAENSLL